MVTSLVSAICCRTQCDGYIEAKPMCRYLKPGEGEGAIRCPKIAIDKGRNYRQCLTGAHATAVCCVAQWQRRNKVGKSPGECHAKSGKEPPEAHHPAQREPTVLAWLRTCQRKRLEWRAAKEPEPSRTPIVLSPTKHLSCPLLFLI